MFASLAPQRRDPLLGLIDMFASDPRPSKIDLGVGTYRDDAGATPVMRAVKGAEARLLEAQQTKSYLGCQGDEAFVELLTPIVFGPDRARPDRLLGVQTPGGCGALRLGAELVTRARPGATVWLGAPSWPNHAPIFQAAGLVPRDYAHFDRRTQAIDFDALCAALSEARPGDVVLLQGCCHNPTGCDLDARHWERVADLLGERELLPFLDLAYQGLGDGLDEDARGVRTVLARVPRALVAYSCDKNFGLYRDRTGALFVLADDADTAARVHGNLLSLIRVNWSMPPDHGAAVVRTALADPALRASWRDELDGMRARIARVRQAVALADPSLSFLAAQKGMFSQLPVDPGFAARLREEHAIYVADSGRVNMAGLREADVQRFAQAVGATRRAPGDR